MPIDRLMLPSMLIREFDRIGIAGKTAVSPDDITVPEGVNDHASYRERALMLFEFFVAARLRSRANKRYDIAKDAVVKSGMLAKMDEIKAGESGMLVSTTLVNVTGKKKNPASRLDPTSLKTELRKAGVAADVIEKAFAAAMKQNEPAKEFEPMLVGGSTDLDC